MTNIEKSDPLILDGATIDTLLNTKDLVSAIHEGFTHGASAPQRLHYELDGENSNRFLLLMPAWNTEIVATKIVTVYPQQVPSIAAQYLIFDARSGLLRAIMDGTALTPWRTAAVSALASSFLSRPDSRSLLLLGTGAVARCLVRAHSWVRTFDNIFVWGRDASRLQAFIDDARSDGYPCESVRDYRDVVPAVDIVSCATAAIDPLILGADIRAGTHVDLVGAFRPTMREADSDLIQIASKYADTIGGAIKEGGDYAIPIAEGLMTEDDIAGDLVGLASGRTMSRRREDEVTVFKSVGTAVADLSAGAFALHRNISQQR